RVIFLVALVFGAWLTARLLPQIGLGGVEPTALVAPPPAWGIPMPVWLIVSGLLIGFGTKIGNGCTSGHGVCGLARLSFRSLVAVAVFFGVAILTVTVTGIV
ncbi:MAG: YeeE/YedE family protein, partial [Alphaproteobacteria bacterium]